MRKASVRSKKFTFTKSALTGLPAHDPSSPSRECEYSDSEVSGLKLLVSKNGRKFFHLRYRHRGRKRAIRIGEFPALSVLDARTKALEYKRMVDLGDDPLVERDKKNDALSFREFAEKEYLPYAKANKKSWKDDDNKLTNELIPLWGRWGLSELSAREIQQHLSRVKARSSGTNANRHYALLHKMFNMAVQWGYLQENPITGKIKKAKENPNRERYLKREEIAGLFQALDRSPNRVAACAVKFLLATATRLSETLTLKWSTVDLESRVARLGITKIGKGRDVLLNESALETLEEMKTCRVAGNPYVFPGIGPKGHFTAPRKVFQKALAEAGIEHCRVHDLRHTGASIIVNSGMALQQAQRVLGHTSIQMTLRYAHLADKKVREASDAIGAEIKKAMGV